MRNRWLALWVLVSFLAQAAWPVAQAAAQEAPEAVAARYALPGETVYTYPRALLYQGQRYYLHAFSPQAQLPFEPQFFSSLPNWLATGKVTGVLVTTSSAAVEDEATIAKVLTLFQAGNVLYTIRAMNPELSWVENSFAADMYGLVIYNPLFIQQWIEHGLGFKEADYIKEALRGIIGTQQTEPDFLQSLGEATANEVANYSSFEAAVEAAVEASDNVVGRGNKIPDVIKDFKRSFKRWSKDSETLTSIGGVSISLDNALNLIELLPRLLWLMQLDQERGQWLNQYLNRYSNSPGAEMSRTERNALAEIATESTNAFAQRLDIIERFAKEQVEDLAEKYLGAGSRAAAKPLLRDLLGKNGVKIFGRSVTAHRVLSWALAVDAGLTVADYAYGLSDLYNNFQVGAKADELRKKFKTVRESLQAQVPLEATILEGQLIEQYQMVYMLEALAAVQLIRSYADGVEATLDPNRVSGKDTSPLFGIDFFKTREKREAVAYLHSSAAQGEVLAEQTVLYPPWVTTGTHLALQRLTTIQLTLDNSAKKGFEATGPADYWLTATEGYQGGSLWTKNETTKIQNTASWKLSFNQTGVYRAQAYIPPASPELVCRTPRRRVIVLLAQPPMGK